jgi:hypothetical protein
VAAGGEPLHGPDRLAGRAPARRILFPEPREISLECSCPDWAEVCKHVAAVLYGVGTRLDEKPELFFVLRQVDQAELLGSATGALSPSRAVGGKRVAADKLADVFGIDIVDEPPRRTSPASRAGTMSKPRRRKT